MLKIIAPISLLALSLNSFASINIPTADCIGVDSSRTGLATYTANGIFNNGPYSASTRAAVTPANSTPYVIDRTLKVICAAAITSSYGEYLDVEIKGVDYHPTKKVACTARSYDSAGKEIEKTMSELTDIEFDGANYTLKIHSDEFNGNGKIVSVACSIPDRGPTTTTVSGDIRVNEIQASSIKSIRVY